MKSHRGTIVNMDTTKPSSGRRERKRELTKQGLVEAAFNLFQTRSYDDTTVDDIVAAADMAKVTFYYHFRSKEELILEMKRHTATETMGRAQAQLDENHSVAEILDTLMTDLTNWTEKNWRILEVFAAQRFGTAKGGVCPGEEESPLVLFLAALVKHGQSRGELRKDLNPSQVAHFITIGIMNEHFHWMHNGRQPGAIKPSLDRCIDFLMNGIADKSDTKK
jgi:AcrR family transcriptional regulator